MASKQSAFKITGGQNYARNTLPGVVFTIMIPHALEYYKASSKGLKKKKKKHAYNA